MHGQRRFRRTAMLAGAAVLLTVAGSVAQAEVQPGRVEGNVRAGDVNDPLRGRDIPGLAADPTDPPHVVMIDEDFLAGQCDFHTSFDGGKTWTSNGHLTVPSDFADPPCRTFDSGGYAHFNKSVVFGSGQNVYTTYASHRGAQQRPESGADKVGGEGDSVIVNRSTDGGKTFETGTVAIKGATDSRPFIIRPGVAVQPRPQGDKVYAVGWYVINPPGAGASGGAGDRRTVVVSSEDGGKTWSNPVEAQGPDEKVREIAPPVVGPDGAVYIAWRNRDDPATAPHPIVVAKSSDGGATWARTPIGDVGPAPTSAPAPAGSSGYPRMAVDSKNGSLYVVYDGFNFGDLDTVFQRSTDGGTTWSAPLRVNDDPKGTGVRQLTPQVFVAPNSRVDVIWMDTRATYPSAIVPKPAGSGDIYYSSSSDGGATFSSNRRITDRSFNLDNGLLARIGTYTWYGPAAVPLGNDSVLFAWGEGRYGNVDNDTNDIVLATMQLGPAPGAANVVDLPKASAANLSVAVSQVAYPGGSERIGAAFTSKLVVVNKDDVAGAWAGAVLARANASPLLVTNGTTLTKEQKGEIRRLNPTGLYVVGNEKSIPEKLVNEIKGAGVITTLAATPPPPATTTTGPPMAGAPAPATTTTLAPTPTANKASVVRLAGTTPAEIGKAVAGALDVRSDEEKGRAVSAFAGAVAVNPATSEGAAGIAFAAALRLPVVFVDRDGVPAPTVDVLNGAAVKATYVIGGPRAVSDAVMAKLPGAKRLGGADEAATTAAVTDEIKARGLPVNVVYVADQDRPVDAAVAAAAVARTGGLLVLSPGADPAKAEEQVKRMGLTPQVDRLVVAQSATSTRIPWPLIALSGLLAVIGIVLIDRAAARRRANVSEGAAPVSSNGSGGKRSSSRSQSESQ